MGLLHVDENIGGFGAIGIWMELFSVQNTFKGCCVDCIFKIKLYTLGYTPKGILQGYGLGYP